jgi:uncharacterized membrane protein (DUF4010 family)
VDLGQLEPFFIALFIGALVGVERTHHQLSQPTSLAGLRTFILLAELGAIAAWLSRAMGSSAVFVGGLGCVTAVIITGYVLRQRGRDETVGLTTEIAAALVYVLGAVAVYGPALIAVALGIVTAGLLAMKSTLHGAVERVSREDLMATLRLLFASFIVLPLLPNHPVDPWGALNPFKLWLLVILISGLSMVGYVAARLLGASQGTLLAGLFGGLVSSTAVTLTFARQSREEPELSGALATGTLLAWTVMFLRVLVLVGVLRWPILSTALLPVGSMAAVGIGLVVLALRDYARRPASLTPRELALKNPFRLWPAIKFAALFAVVLVIAKLVQSHAPGQGLYWLSGVAGSTDVDAIVLSLTELHAKGEAATVVVVRGLVIASLANTVVKLALLAALGTRQIAWRLAPAAALMVGVGVAMLALGSG